MQLRKFIIVAALVGDGLLLPSGARAATPVNPREAVADLANQLATVKAQFEERLRAQETEARKREENIRAQSAAELDKVRREAADRAAQERNEWQATAQGLQETVKAASVREDAREQSAAPRVGAFSAGLTLRGYVQSDFQIRQSSEDQLNPTSGRPLNNDRFLVRRARILLDVERTYTEGGIELDGNTVNGPAVGIVGARASVKLPGPGPSDPPLVMLSAGALRIPFGAELTESERERPFMERSTVSRAMFPSEFDLGVRVQGGWRFLRYAVAVMNGEPLNESSFAGLDPNHQKDLMGRLGVDTGRADFRVQGGTSVLYGTGFHSGASASKPVLRWTDVDGNGSYSSTSETTGTPGAAASESKNFTRFAVNADLALSGTLVPDWGVLGATTVRGEVTWAKNLDRGLIGADPHGELARDSRELGYSVGITQMVLRYGIVGVRYDFYDPDRDRYVRSSGDLVPSDLSFYSFSFMGGVVVPWGRLLVQVDLNRNHLGLTSGATPGNLADNAVTARAEVAF